MPEAIAERGQFGDRLVELVRLSGEHLSIDAHTPVRGEHALDFVQRESRRPTDRDERQPFEDARIERRRRPCRPIEVINPFSS